MMSSRPPPPNRRTTKNSRQLLAIGSQRLAFSNKFRRDTRPEGSLLVFIFSPLDGGNIEMGARPRAPQPYHSKSSQESSIIK